MKNAFIAACCAVMIVFFLNAKAIAGNNVVVGISIPSADHGWTGGVVWWGERAVAEFSKEYPNIEFVFRVSGSEDGQVSDIEDMFARKVDALVILPHRPAPLTTVLNKMHKAGAFIAVVDRSIPKVPKDVYIAGDNYGFGYKCGRHLASALGGKGNILVIEGIPCEGNAHRIEGFKAGIAGYPDIVVMDSRPAYWSPPKAYELMVEYLRKFSRIDAVWCGDDDMLEEAVRAYQESGRSDVAFFLGGGGSKNVVKRIMDNDPLVRATVTYPPKMIYDAVAFVVEQLTRGGEFQKEIVVPSQLITKENAKDYYYPESVY